VMGSIWMDIVDLPDEKWRPAGSTAERPEY